MPRISFTSNLQRHLACPAAEVPGATVADALERVFAGNPRLKSYLLDDQGRLRRHVTVYVNDQPVQDRVRLTDVVGDDDELFVFQALTGG